MAFHWFCFNVRSSILLLKKRLEVAQRRNTMLIRYSQANGLPIPILKASNPLPNRRLVVIPASSSTNEYGITFDSIVPASHSTPTHIEKEVIESPKPVSRGSQTTVRSKTSAVTIKEEKKGFRLNIFKGLFGKSPKSKKSDPLPGTPPPTTITISPSESLPGPTTLIRSNSSISQFPRRPLSGSRQRKLEAYQFSMQPIQSHLDSNKGVKERPTPSAKLIEKFTNPGPVLLPRYARDLVRSHRALEPVLEPSEDSKWRYAGRALAEWDIIVRQCDAYVDSILGRRESIPEEVNEEDDMVYPGATCNSSVPSSPISMSASRVIIENLHIPRMTVELPKFYFTGKSNREP